MSAHILLYTDDPGVGGVAQYNHAILLELAAQGHRVTCVQGLTHNPLIEEQKQQGIRHRWLRFDPIKEFSQTFANGADAEEIFTSDRPDLILFSDACPISNLAAKQVAMQMQIPYVVVIGFVAPDLARHFGVGVDASAYLDLLHRQYQWASAVIAVSHDNLKLLHQLYRLPLEQGQVIHYGRPEIYFTPQDRTVGDRLRRQLDIPSDAVVCFTAARLEADKGFQYQLDAIVQLRQTPVWSQLYFVWAGDGSQKEWITQALHEAGLTDRVKLIGHRWDIADWHNAVDIFILPSEVEGMPLAIMEAMAKGVPVIASAVSGIPEELGNTGQLLPDPLQNPQGAIQRLVATIQRWATDAALRQQIGDAERQRASTMFRQQRMVEETRRVIERSLPPLLRAHPPTVSTQAPVNSTDLLFPSGDYVSPNLLRVKPDDAFPHKVVGDPKTCRWPYLRRDVPHNWYVDERWPLIGFLSRDEAHILYNNALQFRGKRALEVGCWMGWSACHLALAGVELDVIDPILGQPDAFASVSSSLQSAGVLDSVQLIAGYSPQAVEQLAVQEQRKWSLIFIDGNHEAPGPLQDAIACEQLAEPDAMIVFHDLASPDVAQGLDYLRQRGWNTLVYQTMQIMGVAWRGQVQPIEHAPDPDVQWTVPNHLTYYSISGYSSVYRPLARVSEPTPTPSPAASSTPVPAPVPPEKTTAATVPVPAQTSTATISVSDVQDRMRQAVALFNSGNPVEALRVAEDAAAMGLDVPEMHYLRSVLLCEVGRHREGLEAAKAELRINPQHAPSQTQIEKLTQALFSSNVTPIPTAERAWNTALPRDTLLSIHRASLNYSYRGVPMIKNPFDLALYPLLLWHLKPRTIIEIGSKDGGSALWLGDMLTNFGINGHVYSIDIVRVDGLFHPHVTFMEGNGRSLAETLTPEFLNALPRPLLVIDDADHAYETTQHILQFFHPHLKADEYIVVEDGIISDLFQDEDYNSGPHRALKEFLADHADAYEMDAQYCDLFGYNLTWNTNGYLRKLKDTPLRPEPVPVTAPVTAQTDTLLERLLQVVEQLPASQLLVQPDGVDRDRLLPLLQQAQTEQRAGHLEPAIALYHQLLDLNPGSALAHRQLGTLYWASGQVAKSITHHSLAHSAHRAWDASTSEFRALLTTVQRVTQCGDATLLGLYQLTQQLCLDDQPGSLVLGGQVDAGAIALAATVVQRYSLRPRSVYAYCAEPGMIPTLTQHLADISQSLPIQDAIDVLTGPLPEVLASEPDALADIALLYLGDAGYALTGALFQTLAPAVVRDGIVLFHWQGEGQGGFAAIQAQARSHAPHLSWQHLDETTLWSRVSSEAQADTNFVQHLWQTAQLADKMGDRSLAERCAQAVLRILPGCVEAETLMSGRSRLPLSQPLPLEPDVDEDVPEPVEAVEALPEIDEALQMLGIESLEALEALIAQCQQTTLNPLAIGQLRRIRKHLAEQWLELWGDELDATYSGSLGKAHTLLLTSGLREEPLTESERQFRDEAIAFIQDGIGEPGGLQHILALMLYIYPHQVGFPVDWAAIPGWLMPAYMTFLFTPPQLFQQVGEIDRYCDRVAQHVTLLYRAVTEQSDAPWLVHATTVFVQQADFLPFYFTSRNWIELYTQRGEILEWVMRQTNAQIEYEFAERGDRSQIRIGVLAEHFASSAETLATLPVFKQLDRDQFHITLFPVTTQHTPTEQYCAQYADAVQPLPAERSAQVAAIRQADLDILLIGSNVTARMNSTTELALHRLARIQVGSVNSWVTTGLHSVDYYLSGLYSEPDEDAAAQYSETLVMLEGPAHCYDLEADPQPTMQSPDRASLGLRDPDRVFAAGIRPYSLTPEVIMAWARILTQVPQSRLLLYPIETDGRMMELTHSLREQALNIFAQQGVSEQQLIWLAPMPHRAQIAAYMQLVDVYLDAFPASATAALLEPLTVGVPIVTLDGTACRSRAGAALLGALSAFECIAEDETAYVDLAIALATQPDLRQSVSQHLREAMQYTPLFLDPVQYADQIAAVFEQLVQTDDQSRVRQTYKLRTTNFIAFPDWTQPDETVFQTILDLLRPILAYPRSEEMTVLIYSDPIPAEDADLMLSGALMQLLTEEAIDMVGAGPEITLVRSLNSATWDHLLAHISARLVTSHDDPDAIALAGADTLPVQSGDDFDREDLS